jgi:S-disulfanyl-L-cysteine oxidoreductase SoxD
MSSSRSRRALAFTGAVLALAAGAAWAQSAAYPGICRAATASEIKAWDIDVRPDFKGLPKGQGSVAQGQDVWEAKCASCHGIFGESNEVFTPLVGGTTAEDVKTGHVARLLDRGYPGRTTLMKVPTVSTLWDYIHRAMPWNAPKSLSTNEVYAVTAFLLNLGGVVPENFTLSDSTMAQAQARMPNRNGITTDHGMWPGRSIGNGGKPDVKAVACMKNCAGEPKLSSFLPDFARNAHGNLADQNRLVGAQHGANTAPAAPAASPGAKPPPAPMAVGGAAASAVPALLQQHNCLACHGLDAKIVGPGLRDVARKYAGRADALDYLKTKIRNGGSGLWGAIPMPAQTLPDADLGTIAQWLADGAKP